MYHWRSDFNALKVDENDAIFDKNQSVLHMRHSLPHERFSFHFHYEIVIIVAFHYMHNLVVMVVYKVTLKCAHCLQIIIIM